MKILLVAFGFVAIYLDCLSQAAHIVFIHQMASPSHVLASNPLAEALVLKGHKVTYIDPISRHLISLPLLNNISHILPNKLKTYTEACFDAGFDLLNRLEDRTPNWLLVGEKLNFDTCEALLGSVEFQNWMDSKPKVDLIYADNAPGPECILGVAHKLKSKLAVFLPLPMIPKLLDAVGVATESSSIPVWKFIFKTPMSFLDRIRNTLSLIGVGFNQIQNWGEIEDLIKRELKISNLPSLEELYENISLVLMNGHFIDEHSRALPPLFVNAPGLHIQPSNAPLPDEIQAFLDSKNEKGKRSDGFVYISFGTLIKPKKLQEHVGEIFLNAINAFPNISFVWRWYGDFPYKQPKNLYLAKWVPQQDLLAHPKMRGFVTQAGRPSIQEAIYNAVPLITFPILGDQDYNANMLEKLGVSINLEIKEITTEKFKNALSAILNDHKITERSKEVSKLYRDLPMKPIDTAVWWTEYVLRNDNTDHLKPLARHQTLLQRMLLDIWVFIALSTLSFLYLSLLIVRFSYKIMKYFVSSLLRMPKSKTQ